MIYNNVLELIGETPLVRLKKIEKYFDLDYNLYAKFERSNPSGSVKDRASLYIIQDALNSNKINKSTTLIEATSGNTGISISMIGAYLGLKVIIVMPESSSVERRKMMIAYGAKLVLTPSSLGVKGSVDKAEELHKNITNSFLTHQFSNEANFNAHYMTTGQEIIKDLNKVDYFFAGIGTSGTLCGTGKRLKEFNQLCKVIGIEPEGSQLFEQGITGPHKIQGIGPNFIPDIYKKECVDECINVSNEEAYEMTKILAQQEGLFCGISSGCAIYGVIKKMKSIESTKNLNVVTVLPDNGERYLSVEGLYEDNNR